MHQTLKEHLEDQQLGALLKAPDFSEGDSAWTVVMEPLDASRSWNGHTRNCPRQNISWRLPSDNLTCCLLGAGHFRTCSTILAGAEEIFWFNLMRE